MRALELGDLLQCMGPFMALPCQQLRCTNQLNLRPLSKCCCHSLSGTFEWGRLLMTDAVEKVDFANGVSLWSFDLLSVLKQLKKGDFDAEPD